jgi:hypothetical protein
MLIVREYRITYENHVLLRQLRSVARLLLTPYTHSVPVRTVQSIQASFR